MRRNFATLHTRSTRLPKYQRKRGKKTATKKKNSSKLKLPFLITRFGQLTSACSHSALCVSADRAGTNSVHPKKERKSVKVLLKCFSSNFLSFFLYLRWDNTWDETDRWDDDPPTPFADTLLCNFHSTHKQRAKLELFLDDEWRRHRRRTLILSTSAHVTRPKGQRDSCDRRFPNWRRRKVQRKVQNREGKEKVLLDRKFHRRFLVIKNVVFCMRYYSKNNNTSLSGKRTN